MANRATRASNVTVSSVVRFADFSCLIGSAIVVRRGVIHPRGRGLHRAPRQQPHPLLASPGPKLSRREEALLRVLYPVRKL
jgi:hypothetical protein